MNGVVEGPVVLRVVLGDASLKEGQLVRTTAGTRDLVVVVEPGPQLALRIAGYVAPSGDPRHARLVWAEPDGRRVTRYAPIREDGWTRFVRLPAEREVEVWALADAGRPVHRAGLRAGAEEVRVEPVAGREIRGKLLVAPRDAENHVTLRAEVLGHRGFEVGKATVARDGSFVVSDLPEGTYRVSAWFAFGEVSRPVTQDLRTGTTDAVFDVRR
jgi:hypothetical protein